MRPYSLAVLLVLLAGACRSGPGPEGAGSSNRSVISQEELDALPPLSVHQAIERLRPTWLRGRVITVRGVSVERRYPAVFIDGVPSGDLQRLHELITRNVREVRFYSSSDATTRFGTGYPAGMIEVVMRRGGGGSGVAYP